MAETATAAPPPSSTATLETPERDWSKLNDLFPDDELEAPPAVPAKEATVATEPPKTEATAVTEETPEELKALDALLASAKPEPEPEPPKVTLSPEAQQLEHWKSNPEFAREAVQAAQGMIQLEIAASKGDVPAVIGMFAKPFQQALTEHIYQENKEAFVQRFIDEHEGKSGKPDPEVARLRSELDVLKGTVTERQQREQTAQQAETQKQQRERYRTYWNSLFKSVGLEDNKKAQSTLRGSVLDSIAEAAEAGDKDALKIATQIRQGRYAALGPKFREAYVEWIKDQKAKTTADTSIRNAQEQKQAGKLGVTAVETAPTNGDPDHDADGKRTKGFWERNLKKIGLD